MQTLKIELEDNLYQNVLQSDINIQEKFKEFLFDLVDDSYPAISTDEAKKRVSYAVEKYKNSTGTYLKTEEYENRINNYMHNLEIKYANN